MTPTLHVMFRILPLLLMLVVARLAAAADPLVEAGFSAEQTLVGQPIQLEVAVTDATKVEPIQLPDIEGLKYEELEPASRTTLDVQRGVRRQTITYRFNIVPTKSGVFTIPPISISVDGRQYSTEEHTLTVPASGPPVIVEIIASKASAFVGEPISLTLRILIKPYREPRLNVTLDEGDMWGMVDLQESAWGEFESILQGMSARDQRPTGRPQVRALDATTNETYYAYELRKTLWPRSTGVLDPGEISVVMTYPTRLERTIARLVLAGSRVIKTRAEAPAVEIRPIPTEGRPPEFRGAVGQFTISASAKPIDVAVGEPVTLTLSIADRTQNGSDLASLAPPPLTEDLALRQDFRMPNDPLAGDIGHRSKVFRQTIRPLRETVTAIPPVRFAYFDPEREAFVTLATEPIALRVRPSERLSSAEIVDSGADRAAPAAAGLTEVAGGIRANVTDPELLLAQHAAPSPRLLGALLVAPPALFALGSFIIARRDRLRADPSLRRRQEALSAARRRLHSAAGQPPAEAAASIFAAITGYISDRLSLPPGSLTRAEALDHLSRQQVPSDLLSRVDMLLQRAEQIRYTGSTVGDPSIQPDAQRLIEELARQRLESRNTSVGAAA